jgi:hydroxymethylpyrimidine pyrophosphatase-like HAD family hydrolase
MNHKILCVDLDATLLCDDKSITQKNREAIHRMLEAGHYIALATGRPVETAREVARELGLNTPGCYMIAFNGAVLYDCAADRVLLKRSLPIEIVQELFDKAKRAGLYVQTYNSTDLITTKHTKELDYYVKQARISYKISPNILDALEEEPQKVMLISLDQRDKLERFQKKMEGMNGMVLLS